MHKGNVRKLAMPNGNFFLIVWAQISALVLSGRLSQLSENVQCKYISILPLFQLK